MNFGHPKVLWLSLALLPLLALFLWATWRKRQALVRQFVQHKTLAQATLGISVARQKIRRLLIFVAAGLLLLAIARPQWGFTWEEASQRGRDIIVAIDTSRSMLATDIQPNRLTRAKLAALDLLKLGQFDRFGLVAFAGSAFLQCPLTFDDEAFRQSAQILQTGIIPQGGTAIGSAIETARDAFGDDADENHRVLVLFTDGEDHEQNIDEVVTDAVDTGLRIFTVGVGTPAGELLRIRDEQGNQAFVKDDAGNVVKSRLNEEVLREIATRGQGFYLQLQGGNTMEVLYEKGLAPLPTSERTTKLMKRFKEQFYWPLAAAILLLIIEVFVPDQKRATRAKAEGKASSAASASVAMLLLLILVPDSLADAKKALRHYKAEEYKSALAEYQRLLEESPNNAHLHYNAGAAAYQLNKFDIASEEFLAAAKTRDIDLQQQSFYNLGNAQYFLGEDSNPQEKIAVWEQAVQHFEAALKLNSGDKDAEFNRDFVRKKVEELKQQQQEQKDNKDNQEKKQDDTSKDQQKQDNSGQQEEQKSEEEKKNQENQQKQDAKDKADQEQAKQGGEKESQDQKPEGGSQGEYAQLGQMTPAQAKQLLDAQRDEEKALIFVPPESKSESRNRSFKDW